jgi:prefoldin subunit 5
MKVIDKLSTYAALIGVVSAIGGGFYAWGEFNNRISVLEKKKFVVNQTVDLNPVNERISKLEVDVLDRISDVEKNIKPTDLTSVLQSIANVREEMASLDIPDEVDLSPVNKSIKELEEKIAELKQEVAIVSKENELQDVLIKEIKTKANNPLAN